MTRREPTGPPLRAQRHRALEAALRESADDDLLRLLAASRIEDDGFATVSLPGSDAPVFVKLVPLTELELRAENRGSTANLFELPVHYGYRLGSVGFGAWRELEVLRMANEWVLSDQCRGFPLLHGWRVLPLVFRYDDDRSGTQIWGADAAIERRVSAIAEATSSAVLFLEHFPMNLLGWLRDRLGAGVDPAGLVRSVEGTVFELLSFLHDQGVLHMDAHFENVFTDGKRLVLGDFGLAIARSFPLGADERDFFDRHPNFDRCTVVTSMVHAVVTHYDANEDWRETLRALIAGTHRATQNVPPALRSYLASRGPVALATGDFYRRLLGDLTTGYPAARLQELLDGA